MIREQTLPTSPFTGQASQLKALREEKQEISERFHFLPAVSAFLASAVFKDGRRKGHSVSKASLHNLQDDFKELVGGEMAQKEKIDIRQREAQNTQAYLQPALHA